MKKIITALLLLLIVMPAAGQAARPRSSLTAAIVAKKTADFRRKAKKHETARRQQNVVVEHLDSTYEYAYGQLIQKTLYSRNAEGFALIEDTYGCTDEGHFKQQRTATRVEPDGTYATYTSLPDEAGAWQFAFRTVVHDGIYERTDTYADGRWQLFTDTKVSYDAQGRITEEESIETLGGEARTAARTVNTYNADGTLMSSIFTEYEEDGTTYTATTTYAYSNTNPRKLATTVDSEGDTLVEQYNQLGDTAEYRALEDGQLRYIEKSYNDKGIAYSEYITYDGEGRIWSAMKYAVEAAGDAATYTSWEYDTATGQYKPATRQAELPEGTYDYIYADDVWQASHSVVYTSDDRGNLIRETSYDYGYDETYETARKVYFYDYAPAGIDAQRTGTAAATARYDLQGRRTGAAARGLMIQQGRKLIVK